MRTIQVFLGIILLPIISLSQPSGYYNGTGGKQGNDLRMALNDIIRYHIPHDYNAAKYILLESDADPNYNNHVILVYTGRSQYGLDYGIGNNDLNREHVWAKSHGSFNEEPPMFSDVHALKPADASVNISRSNLDFDWGGSVHPEATGCRYDGDSWEPRDEVKGDIARIIFYMSVRYVGKNGEPNLTVVDEVNTYPQAKHGKLSALMEWNLIDPPDEFERNRNEVIWGYQKNRNPFIDHPEFAERIWGQHPAGPFIDDVVASPQQPGGQDPISITCTIHQASQASDVTVWYGDDYENPDQSVTMTQDGAYWTGQIPPRDGGMSTFFIIEAEADGKIITSIPYDIYISPDPGSALVSVSEIQGEQSISPYNGQTVRTSGIVTAVMNNGYYIQNGTGAWSGLFVYDDLFHPKTGDLIEVRGEVDEYYEMTELTDVTSMTVISRYNPLPAPFEIPAAAASESYESVLIKISNAVCTDDDYSLWEVNDGTGSILINNNPMFTFEADVGDTYDITGPLSFSFGEYQVELRHYQDVGYTAYNDLIITNKSLEVYPVPVQNYFFLQKNTKGSQQYTIELIDLKGMILLSHDYLLNEGQRETINCSDMPSGLYFLKITSSSDQHLKKILIR